jgi:hypothetical protein
MSQHDYVIDNQSAPAARADINAVLQAIATTNSGGTAPVTTFANQIWYDTATNEIKKRNEANSAWIVLGTIDDTGGTFTPNSLLTTAGIAPATLVTAAETIASNNNDTTLPTSAAVKAYADATAASAAAGVVSATTANVLAATAGATGGAVGTYAWLRSNTTGTSVTVGNTVTGYLYAAFEATSTLVEPDNGGTAPGTWRAMGSGGGFSGRWVLTLFLRIA